MQMKNRRCFPGRITRSLAGCVLWNNILERRFARSAHGLGCCYFSEMHAASRSAADRVERFDRRPIEPFELFTSEFGQNSVRIQENSSKIFRKFLKFEKFSTFSKVFSEIPRNFRQNRCKIR